MPSACHKLYQMVSEGTMSNLQRTFKPIDTKNIYAELLRRLYRNVQHEKY
jgi:hypothetical protein